jgi:peptide/nickel transport system substrate-binding protein
LALLLALPSCTAEPEAQTAPATGNHLVIGATTTFETPNELITLSSDFNADIVRMMFLPLLQEQSDYQEGPPTFAPRLAESWSFSDDRLQLTFVLRDGLRWSDGQPITAEDVRFTWQAQTSEDVVWAYSFIKDAITDVEVVDPTTAVFHFSRPSATQLIDANEGVILPKHAWGKLPFDRWRKDPQYFLDNLITSGPFLLEDWKRQQQITLVRNPDYYEPGKPILDRVIFRYVREPAALFAQLLNGEIDMSLDMRPADAQRVVDAPGLSLVEFASRQYTFITWNLLRPQFTDKRVRQALAMAVDRQTIIDTLWFGHARLSDSPIISTVWAHNDRLRPWPYDPEGARHLLNRAGWVDSDGDGIREKDGMRFSFELTTNPGNQIRWDAMQMIRSQLRAVGIEAKPRRIEYETLSALNAAHDYDATLTALIIDTSLDLTGTLHSSSIDEGYNFGSFVNAEVDQQIELANAEIDQRQALPYYQRVQAIVHEEQPLLFLWEPYRMIGVRSHFHITPTALSSYFGIEDWSVQPVVVAP